jgi:hypothetical protein
MYGAKNIVVLEWIDPKSRNLHLNENLREYNDQTAINAATYAYAADDQYMQQLQASGSLHSAHSLRRQSTRAR